HARDPPPHQPAVVEQAALGDRHHRRPPGARAHHHRTDQRGARLQADARRRRATGPQWPGAFRAVHLVHHPVRAAAMAADFLSQEEVDALLRGVTGESDEPTADEASTEGVRPYNLATQERIVRGRMPTMELINERFARYLRIGLFNYMHRNAEVSVGPIKVQKYAEFVRNLVVPTNLNLVIAKPLRGTGLVVFDPNLVVLVVDNMFGGDGRFHTRVEGRDFTPTEQRIIQGMLEVVCTEYARAWAQVFKLQLEYVRSEMNSRFANIATPSEVVVATSFSLALGGAQADMHVCFPYSMLEPIRDLLYSTMQSDHLTS